MQENIKKSPVSSNYLSFIFSLMILFLATFGIIAYGQNNQTAQAASPNRLELNAEIKLGGFMEIYAVCDASNGTMIYSAVRIGTGIALTSVPNGCQKK